MSPRRLSHATRDRLWHRVAVLEDDAAVLRARRDFPRLGRNPYDAADRIRALETTADHIRGLIARSDAAACS